MNISISKRDAFKQELKDLLVKYDATIRADDWGGGMAGPDIRISMVVPDTNCRYSDIIFGNVIDSTDL